MVKVFEQEAIPIHILVGTSVGALVGGAYAGGIGPAELEKKVDEYLNSPEFQSLGIKVIEKAHEPNGGSYRNRI